MKLMQPSKSKITVETGAKVVAVALAAAGPALGQPVAKTIADIAGLQEELDAKATQADIDAALAAYMPNAIFDAADNRDRLEWSAGNLQFFINDALYAQMNGASPLTLFVGDLRLNNNSDLRFNSVNGIGWNSHATSASIAPDVDILRLEAGWLKVGNGAGGLGSLSVGGLDLTNAGWPNLRSNTGGIYLGTSGNNSMMSLYYNGVGELRMRQNVQLVWDSQLHLEVNLADAGVGYDSEGVVKITDGSTSGLGALKASQLFVEPNEALDTDLMGMQIKNAVYDDGWVMSHAGDGELYFGIIGEPSSFRFSWAAAGPVNKMEFFNGVSGWKTLRTQGNDWYVDDAHLTTGYGLWTRGTRGQYGMDSDGAALNFTAGGSAMMRLRGDLGFVGVGTSGVTPAHTLDVDGTFRATGVVSANLRVVSGDYRDANNFAQLAGSVGLSMRDVGQVLWSSGASFTNGKDAGLARARENWVKVTNGSTGYGGLEVHEQFWYGGTVEGAGLTAYRGGGANADKFFMEATWPDSYAALYQLNLSAKEFYFVTDATGDWGTYEDTFQIITGAAVMIDTGQFRFSDVGVARDSAGVLRVTDGSTGVGALIASAITGPSDAALQINSGASQNIQFTPGTGGVVTMAGNSGAASLRLTATTNNPYLQFQSGGFIQDLTGGSFRLAAASTGRISYMAGGVDRVSIWNTGEFYLASETPILWRNGNDAGGFTPDIGLARADVGVIGVSDGTTGDGAIAAASFRDPDAGSARIWFDSGILTLRDHHGGDIRIGDGGSGVIGASQYRIGNGLDGIWSGIGIYLPDAGEIAWSATANATSTRDTGLDRHAAGVVAVTDAAGSHGDLILKGAILTTSGAARFYIDGSTGARAGSSKQYTFASGADPTGSAADTGLARQAAGEVRVTDGAGGTGHIYVSNARVDGIVALNGIPTSDPGIANRVWNDGGTLKISAG